MFCAGTCHWTSKRLIMQILHANYKVMNPTLELNQAAGIGLVSTVMSRSANGQGVTEQQGIYTNEGVQKFVMPESKLV